MPITRLSNRYVIALEGPDVREFLQGLITNEIADLSRETPLFTALLTPQGKFVADFFITVAANQSDRLLLDCGGVSADELLKLFKMYKLRAKVDIADERERLEVFAAWDDAEPPHEAEVVFDDQRLRALGKRFIAPQGLSQDENETAYHSHRIALGIPDAATDIETRKTLILEANYDALNAISFTKGCYVGQELTARMKHRGKVRKRLIPVHFEDAGYVAKTDSEVLAESGSKKPAGSIRSSTAGAAIALLRLEDLNVEDSSASIHCENVSGHASIPKWLTPHL